MDPRHIGRLLLFNILGVIIGSLVSSRMIQQRSYRFTWIIGFTSLLSYYLWMEVLSAGTATAGNFIFPLLIQGFGVGMLLASIVTFMIVSIPVELGLSGITLGIMGRLIGTCISTALISKFHAYSEAGHPDLFGARTYAQLQQLVTRDYYYLICWLLFATILFIALVPLVTNKKNNIDPVDNLPI